MAGRSLALLLLMAAAAGAQEKAPEISASKKESFEVASVKPGDPSDRRMMINVAPGRFRAVHAPVILFIRLAWDVQDFQIAGLPDWAKTERVSIEARWSDSADMNPMQMSQDTFPKRLHLRLQDLLESRFAARVHRETKEMPVYALRVSKSGPKLKAPSPQADPKTRE